MVRAGMHRLDLQHRVEHGVDRLPAADPVHGILPGDHRQPGAGVDVAGEILDDRLEPLEPVLPPGLVVAALLEKRLQRIEIERFARADAAARFRASLRNPWPAWDC